MSPPPLRFPDAVRADLEAKQAGLTAEIEERFASLARPCVAVTSKRVAPNPLRRSALSRLFGAQASPPVLGPMESKFGGVPYSEDASEWERVRFFGQIDLASATAVLPPGEPRLTGLLRLDQPMDSSSTEWLRPKWFSQPSLDRAVRVNPESSCKWETGLEFRLEWTLPEGDELEAIWPLPEVPWFEYQQFFPDGYNADGDAELHRMLGHKSGGLFDHYGFNAPPPAGDDLEAYECLLRLPFDNVAGFHWGSNCVYLLVPKVDLARGDLSRIVVTAANA